MTNAHIT